MSDKIKQLQELKDLFDQGLVSQEEFDRVKSEILGAPKKSNKPATSANKDVPTDKVPAKKTAPQKNTQIIVESNNVPTKKSSRWLLKTLLIGVPILIIGMVIWEDQFSRGRWKNQFGSEDNIENYGEYDYEEDYSYEENYEEDYSNESVNNNEQTQGGNSNCVITDVEPSYLGIWVKTESNGNCYIPEGAELIGYGTDFVVVYFNYMYITYDCDCKSIASKESANIEVTAVGNNDIHVRFSNTAYKYDKYWKYR